MEADRINQLKLQRNFDTLRYEVKVFLEGIGFKVAG